MKFTLTIELGNEEMQTPADVVAAISRSLAQHGRDAGSMFDPLKATHGRSILDTNGNTVGGWEVA